MHDFSVMVEIIFQYKESVLTEYVTSMLLLILYSSVWVESTSPVVQCKAILECYITVNLVTQTICTIIQGNNIIKLLYVKLYFPIHGNVFTLSDLQFILHYLHCCHQIKTTMRVTK